MTRGPARGRVFKVGGVWRYEATLDGVIHLTDNGGTLAKMHDACALDVAVLNRMAGAGYELPSWAKVMERFERGLSDMEITSTLRVLLVAFCARHAIIERFDCGATVRDQKCGHRNKATHDYHCTLDPGHAGPHRDYLHCWAYEAFEDSQVTEMNPRDLSFCSCGRGRDCPDSELAKLLAPALEGIYSCCEHCIRCGLGHDLKCSIVEAGEICAEGQTEVSDD